jgi:hypothetical protein
MARLVENLLAGLAEEPTSLILVVHALCERDADARCVAVGIDFVAQLTRKAEKGRFGLIQQGAERISIIANASVDVVRSGYFWVPTPAAL